MAHLQPITGVLKGIIPLSGAKEAPKEARWTLQHKIKRKKKDKSRT